MQCQRAVYPMQQLGPSRFSPGEGDGYQGTERLNERAATGQCAMTSQLPGGSNR